MQRLVQDLVPVERSQDDHGRFAAVTLPYFLCDLQAVHLRHFPVQQHQVIGGVLGVLHLQHLQRIPAGQADIRLDAYLVQNQPGVLRCDFFVVHDQYMHVIRFDVMSCRALMPAVFQRNHHGKLRAFSLFGPDGDFPVHQLHDTPGNGHAQAGAAVFAAAAAVFLGEGIEDLWNKVLIDPDAGIGDHKFQGGLFVKGPGAFYGQGNAPRRIGEFDGVGQDIDQHLLELHIVADIVIADAAGHLALIVEAFFPAL